MAISFDIPPTARLPGLHMVGTVVRRFLISHPVPEEALASYLPPRAELSLFGGKAWVSACFVFINDMRPSYLPASLGMKFHYLIHRTRARLPFPDGELREGVLILEPNIDKRFMAFAGKHITGVRFNRRDIRLTQQGQGWRLTMTDRGVVEYDATIAPPNSNSEISRDSCFATAQEADQFLLGVSYGGQWTKVTGSLCLLPETHEPWETLVTECTTHTNRFLDRLGCTSTQADHVITMTSIPHYFGIRPVRTMLSNH